MTPPILYDLLRRLDEFLRDHAALLHSDPDEFYNRLERFFTYVVCHSYREGLRAFLKRARTPGENGGVP